MTADNGGGGLQRRWCVPTAKRLPGGTAGKARLDIGAYSYRRTGVHFAGICARSDADGDQFVGCIGCMIGLSFGLIRTTSSLPPLASPTPRWITLALTWKP